MEDFNKEFYLPEFEDSTNTSNNQFQTTDDLPLFDEEQMHADQDDELKVPTPPPELKKRYKNLKLKDIEEEYLQEQAEEEKIEIEKVSKKIIKPVFINLKDYGKVTAVIKGTRLNTAYFDESFVKIDDLSATINAEIERSQKNIETIQRKLITMDNHLFGGMED